MGLFGKWRSKKNTEDNSATQSSNPNPNPNLNPENPSPQPETSVFEFGSCARYGGGGQKGASAKVGEEETAGKIMAGFCPVSDHLEPCRWELLPSDSENSPLFRILF